MQISGKVLFLTLIGFVVIFAGIIFLLAGSTKNSKAVTYSKDDTERPRVQVEKSFSDLGEIKVSDVPKADFTIKNTGTKPLQILNITSSCHCTFAQFIYKDNTSAEFGMSNQSRYVTDIAPGESAVIRVIYKPVLMPVFGVVEREVYVTTNDPTAQRLVFSVQANVK